MSAIEPVINVFAKQLLLADKKEASARKRFLTEPTANYEYGYYEGFCVALRGVLETLKEAGRSVEPADAGSLDKPGPNHEQE